VLLRVINSYREGGLDLVVKKYIKLYRKKDTPKSRIKLALLVYTIHCHLLQVPTQHYFGGFWCDELMVPCSSLIKQYCNLCAYSHEYLGWDCEQVRKSLRYVCNPYCKRFLH
jgi:hypothetical protein